MDAQPVLWDWLLRYSSHLLTGVVSFLVALLVHRITSRSANLYYYTSPQQWVMVTVPQPTPPVQPIRASIGTFTLFLWNQGKAPARNVYVGHHIPLPANSAFPDIPRSEENLPGGGRAIVFPVIPSRTLISITYLLVSPVTVEQLLAYVGSEEGAAKLIPVMLQRVWPPALLRSLQVLLFVGAWVAVNFVISLIGFLATVYYFR